MFLGIALPRVIDFRPFDLGWLRSFSKVDAPVRSIPLEWRDKPVAFIVDSESDHGWEGIVFSSRNGQSLIYMPFEENGKALLDESRYLSVAPMDYVATATRVAGSLEEKIGFEGLYSEIQRIRTDRISSADRAWVEQCLHPQKKPVISADTNTLG